MGREDLGLNNPKMRERKKKIKKKKKEVDKNKKKIKEKNQPRLDERGAMADPRKKTELIEIRVFVCLFVFLNWGNRDGEIK